MSHLPAGFVDAMVGRLPGEIAPTKSPKLPAVQARRWVAGKRVPEPTAEEIRKVDRALAREGLYLTPDTVRRLIAETNTALWSEMRDRGEI